MIVVLVFVLILAFINAWTDYRIIAVGGEIDHRNGLIVRGLLISAVTLVTAYSPVDFVFLFCFACLLFWLVFELILNYLRKKPLLYVGYTAWIDREIRDMFPYKPELFLFILKLSWIVILLIFWYGVKL